VVCRACERWNLTPFESRWEAIEQGERAYRDTRVRVSTDNIGLARLRDGTELVRIGNPLRPEFAAWRYGDQFGRRRRKAIMTGVGAAAGVGIAIGGAVTLGVGLAALVPLANILSVAGAFGMSGKLYTRLPRPDGGTFVPIGAPRLVPSDRADYAIEVGYTEQYDAGTPVPRWGALGKFSSVERRGEELGRLVLHGDEAMPLLRWVLPRVNHGGARAGLVRDGVQVMEEIGGPERFGAWAMGKRREWAARSTFGDTGDLRQMPSAVRLAFEMALHEETEQRAMEGELAALERAWTEAEEVAAIADTLLVPAAVDDALTAIKRQSPAR
jgi:hypothetical protein